MLKLQTCGLSSLPINMVDYINCFSSVELNLHSRKNITWLLYIILHVARFELLTFVNGFCGYLHEVKWCLIFFSCTIFWHQGNTALLK